MRIFYTVFLKVFAFLFALAFFITVLSFVISLSKTEFNDDEFTFKNGNINSNNKIALIKLKGPILNDPIHIGEFDFFENYQIIYVNEIKKTLQKLELEKIKGMIVSIDSPGGSVSATYNLHQTLYNFKIKNDVKVFFHTNELLVSGGYWISLVSDKIYANYGSLIGSIGVRGPDWIYFDTPVSISKGIFGESINTKKGIKKFNTIAGESKDLFDSFRIPTEKEYSALQDIVNSIYQDFVNLVSKNRHIENNIIINDLGALIFDAKNAKENFLIDDVISLSEVTDKLVKELSLKDYQIIEKKRKKLSIFEKLLQVQVTSIYETNTVSLIKQEICNILNNQISVIFVQKNINNKC